MSLVKFVSCALFLTVFTAPEIAYSQVRCDEIRPLISWYSPGRGDNFATTNPQWGGPIGVQRSPDYKAYRNEGYVFVEPRDGTVPLFSWYSPSRGDNFITSDPRWAGSAGAERSPDYRFVRVEGHIFNPRSTRPANSVPLDSSWSPDRGDNFASSSPMWVGEVGKENSPDYSLYRREGYLLDPSQFEDCVHTIDTRGILPDFMIADITRSARRRLNVLVRNEGATGSVTRVECATLGSAIRRDTDVSLAQGDSQIIQVSIWPQEGREANCSVSGVASDGTTPEPAGSNNTLAKVPNF